MRFEGELSSLAEAIKPVVSYIGEDEEENRGQVESVIVELSDAATRRDLVDIANRATDLVGFEPVMPSINNIFINAVRNSSEMPVENK